MPALVIASLAAAVCLVLALCGFYKIKPALVQVEAALWKFITLSRSRHLGGARFPVGPETTQRPDPVKVGQRGWRGPAGGDVVPWTSGAVATDRIRICRIADIPAYITMR